MEMSSINMEECKIQEEKKYRIRNNILYVALLLNTIFGLLQFGNGGIYVFILYAILIVGYLLIIRKRRNKDASRR